MKPISEMLDEVKKKSSEGDCNDDYLITQLIAVVKLQDDRIVLTIGILQDDHNYDVTTRNMLNVQSEVAAMLAKMLGDK